MMKKKLEQKDHRRFWCLLGILLLLIMTRYSLQIDLPKAAFLAVIALIAVLGDQDEIMAMCICLIPMHESVDFFYAVAIIVGVYVFKYHNQIHFSTHVLLAFLTIAWELLHCFRSSFAVVELLTDIIPFIVLVVIMAANTESLDYAFIVRAFSWATLGCILVLFIRVLYFSDFNFLVALAGLQRMGEDTHSGIEDAAIEGGQMNSNTLGIITVLAATGLMQLRSKKVSKRSDTVLMCTMLVFAALGASRTYLACLALMILLLIFAEKGGIGKKLRLFAALLLAISVAIAAMAIFFPANLEYFVGRFLVSDITTGRDTLMALYHRFIVDNPDVMYFGIGLQNYGGRLMEHYRVAPTVPHNFVQEIVIAWGIPGILLFVGLFFNMIRGAVRKNRFIGLLNWIPLLIILFKGLAGQILTSAYTMLAFSYAYLSMCTDLTPEDPDDSEDPEALPEAENLG